MRFVSLLATVLLLAPAAAPQTGGQLRLAVTEGSGAVVPRRAPSARRFTVLVTDAAGQPVPQAHVRFHLPGAGPSGSFASGLKSETVLTDSHGKASVYGILWNDVPGPLEITVSGSSGNGAAELRIPVEISAQVSPSRADRANPSFRGPSSSKKWLILAAAGAGAAAALAAAGRKSSAPQVIAPPAAIVVQPSIGTPAITIGKP